MKILVVDDEKLLVKGIRFNLANEGYEVEEAYDGLQALEMIRKGDYDLVLLDLMLPGLDGFSVCRKVRTFSEVPIIMLTAKSEDTDKLSGFDCGADDYMTKPFNLMELKARVRAVLRRTAPEEGKDSALVAGRVTLDPNTRGVTVDGNPVELTGKEFDLLELLVKTPGRVYSRDNILDLVWGYDYPGDVRTVDVHVRRLREKIERDPAQPEIVMTKWGVGYYFKG